MEIITVDCHYMFPQFAASYLCISQGRASFVETNTSHATPKLLAALREHKIPTDRVDWVFVTHAHLDHAAGASSLLASLPNAKLVAHPKAARHLVDPTRLVSSARAVYGDERFTELYGVVDPIPKDRVWAIEDNTQLTWQGAEFKLFYTLGHASHHYCIEERSSRSVFTGDSFGIGYPALRDTELFVFPSTSPTDFDAEQAIATVRKIASLDVDRAWLTHYGAIDDLELAAKKLEEELLFAAQLERSIDLNSSALEAERCQSELTQRFRSLLAERWTERIARLLETDLELNAQGLVVAALRHAGLKP